jgi:hypothetical protein
MFGALVVGLVDDEVQGSECGAGLARHLVSDRAAVHGHYEHLFAYVLGFALKGFLCKALCAADLPIPELVENRGRSIAMPAPDAPALNRDEALDVLGQLVQAFAGGPGPPAAAGILRLSVEPRGDVRFRVLLGRLGARVGPVGIAAVIAACGVGSG